MSKKNKMNRNFGSDLPEVYNMDDIGYMTDESIYERSNRLENERNWLLSSGKDPLLWEVEIAYLRREQDLRKIRAEHHAQYLQKFSVDPNNKAELEAETQVAQDYPEELN